MNLSRRVERTPVVSSDHVPTSSSRNAALKSGTLLMRQAVDVRAQAAAWLHYADILERAAEAAMRRAGRANARLPRIIRRRGRTAGRKAGALKLARR